MNVTEIRAGMKLWYLGFQSSTRYQVEVTKAFRKDDYVIVVYSGVGHQNPVSKAHYPSNFDSYYTDIEWGEELSLQFPVHTYTWPTVTHDSGEFNPQLGLKAIADLNKAMKQAANDIGNEQGFDSPKFVMVEEHELMDTLMEAYQMGEFDGANNTNVEQRYKDFTEWLTNAMLKLSKS